MSLKQIVMKEGNNTPMFNPNKFIKSDRQTLTLCSSLSSNQILFVFIFIIYTRIIESSAIRNPYRERERERARNNTKNSDLLLISIFTLGPAPTVSSNFNTIPKQTERFAYTYTSNII